MERRTIKDPQADKIRRPGNYIDWASGKIQNLCWTKLQLLDVLASRRP